MRKILIDCGGNLGQGFDDLKDKLNIDNSWDVIVFEPNPNCYNSLLGKFSGTNVIVKNQAVHNENGSINFYIPSSDMYSVGGTINSDFHNSLFEGTYDGSIEVETIDLSEYVKTLIPDYEIYLKLDIEGSEYDVLEHMINEKTIDSIKKLFVEFHNQYIKTDLIKKYNLDVRKDDIIKYLSFNNISHDIWN
jgi:FkbM family methyltransferase